jgi:hypothetical protein
MKILFLDNDGVICLSNNWGGRYKKQKEAGRKMSQSTSTLPVDARFDDFDKKAVAVLNSILEETGAEIVVSSDWKKHATVEELGQYYLAQGISKVPIDSTPFFRVLYDEGKVPLNSEFDYNRTHNLEQERHFEILHWLKEHPEVTHWVAVDDLCMSITVTSHFFGEEERDWGLTNFVWTPYDDEGIKQSGIKDKILAFLNEK